MSAYNWQNWSKLQQLDGIDRKLLGTRPGAYVIAAKGSITRAVGIDSEGILDIGESKHLGPRVKAFVSCAQKCAATGHAAGCRYASWGFADRWPLKTLRIRWRKFSSKNQAQREEARLMEAYRKRHLELPPLNRSFSSKT